MQTGKLNFVAHKPSIICLIAPMAIFFLSCGALADTDTTKAPDATVPANAEQPTTKPGESNEVSKADAKAAITINDEGVGYLKNKDFIKAIDCLQKALKLNPDSGLIKANLSVAYNNYGLELRHKPKEALKQFHQAVYVVPNNPPAVENTEGIIKIMGLDPWSFAVRKNLGDEAFNANPQACVDAIVEYSAAEKLADDAELHRKLASLYKMMNDPEMEKEELTAAANHGLRWLRPISKYADSIKEKLAPLWEESNCTAEKNITVDFSVDGNGKITDATIDASSGGSKSEQNKALSLVKNLRKLEAPEGIELPLRLDADLSCNPYKVTVRLDKIDFKEYMAYVQRRIKSVWIHKGISSPQPLRTVVSFTVARDGSLGALAVKQGSSPLIDQKALSAVREAAPFRPLPDGAQPTVDIQFTFDIYNKSAGNKPGDKPTNEQADSKPSK